MAIAKIKTFLDASLKTVSAPLERVNTTIEPEVGIRVIHSPNEKCLRVTVLGARHLPSNFGFTRVNSYVVKVCWSFFFGVIIDDFAFELFCRLTTVADDVKVFFFLFNLIFDYLVF